MGDHGVTPGPYYAMPPTSNERITGNPGETGTKRKAARKKQNKPKKPHLKQTVRHRRKGEMQEQCGRTNNWKGKDDYCSLGSAYGGA